MTPFARILLSSVAWSVAEAAKDLAASAHTVAVLVQQRLHRASSRAAAELARADAEEERARAVAPVPSAPAAQKTSDPKLN